MYMLRFLIFSILRLRLIRSVFVSRWKEHVSVQGWRGLSGQHRHWHPYRHRLHHLLCSLPHVWIPSQVSLIKLCRVFLLILYTVNNSCSIIIQWLVYHDKKKKKKTWTRLVRWSTGLLLHESLFSDVNVKFCRMCSHSWNLLQFALQ